MSYETQISATGAAGYNLAILRREPLRWDFYYLGDLSAATLTAAIRIYPDAPVAAAATPTVTATAASRTYDEWIALDIMTSANIPPGSTGSDSVTVSTVSMTAAASVMVDLPRLAPRGEQTVLYYAIGYGALADSILVAGRLTITETA
jgi:hypothetical protein